MKTQTNTPSHCQRLANTLIDAFLSCLVRLGRQRSIAHRAMFEESSLPENSQNKYSGKSYKTESYSNFNFTFRSDKHA